jgi:hypothetical protein
MKDNVYRKEKREFLRCDFRKPLMYKIISNPKSDDFTSKLMTAVSKNLSAAGILFVTNVTKVPEIASLIVLDVDYRTANICQEIEEQALILNDKFVGRVVRIEDNEDNTCGIGVAFVKKSDPIIKDIENLINK